MNDPSLGSYDMVTPEYYETFQQGTPYHAGAPGWTKAPWPTWGDNPNLAGRQRLATDGLGAVTAIGSTDPSLGAYFQNTYVQPIGRQTGGASTIAAYAPISGTPSGCGCMQAPTSGLGAIDSKKVGIAIVAGAIGLAVYYATRKKRR